MSEPGSPGRGAAVLVGARVASVLVLVGAAVGVLWWWVAPVAQVRIESSGGYFVDPDPETFIASDMWFVGLSLVAGAAVGALLWGYSHRAKTAAVVGLAAGGLAGALVGRWVGQLLGRVDPAAVAKLHIGAVTDVALKLQAVAALLVLPIAALGGWVVRDLVADVRSARRERRDRQHHAVAQDGAGLGVSLGDPPEPAPPPSA